MDLGTLQVFNRGREKKGAPGPQLACGAVRREIAMTAVTSGEAPKGPVAGHARWVRVSHWILAASVLTLFRSAHRNPKSKA